MSQPFDPAHDEFVSRQELGQFPPRLHDVAAVGPRPYTGGKDGWFVGECACGFVTAPKPVESEARVGVERHVRDAIRPIRVREGLGVPVSPVGWVDEEPRMHEGSTSGPIVVPTDDVPDLLGALQRSVESARSRARAYRDALALNEEIARRPSLDGAVPPHVPADRQWVGAEGRGRSVSPPVVGWVDEAQDLLPNEGAASGPIIRPVDDGAVPPHESDAMALGRARREAAERDLQKSFSPNSVGFGDLRFEFNPLTGDVMVTSGSGVLRVEPVSPGVARLSSRRRAGSPGVSS